MFDQRAVTTAPCVLKLNVRCQTWPWDIDGSWHWWTLRPPVALRHPNNSSVTVFSSVAADSKSASAFVCSTFASFRICWSVSITLEPSARPWQVEHRFNGLYNVSFQTKSWQKTKQYHHFGKVGTKHKWNPKTPKRARAIPKWLLTHG